MPSKKVVGELVYEIRGDDTQYSNVINRADAQATKLGGTVSGVSNGMIKSLAGAYLGWQGLKAGIDATVGSAIAYEDAFAGVRKTVDGTEEQLQALSKRFRDLSKEIPISANEFARIGELAGQLGVPIENIDKFSETIAKIGVATNLTTEQASTEFARFANIMGTPLDQVDKMGSAIVGLGNNFATTESEILNFSLNIAGAGKIAGLTEAQVFGIATALSSVGVEAEAGGTAVQKVLIDMNNSVNAGGEQMEKFAKVAGLSAEEFKIAYQENAGNAFNLFVKGLGNAGDDASQILDELGFSDIRLQRAFLSLSNAGDLVTDAISKSTEEFDKNNALQIESEKRFKTTASQVELLKNNAIDLGVSVGNFLLPTINTFLGILIKVTQAINDLGAELILTIKFLGVTSGLAWAMSKAGIATKIFTAQAVTTTSIVSALRTAIIALRNALVALPLALVITVGLVGYTTIMGQIRNLKRELNEQAESENNLADMRAKAVKDAGNLIKSQNKNLQELGKAQNDYWRDFIRNQDEGTNIDLTNTRERIKVAKEKVNQDQEALKILNQNTSATDENADANAQLKAEYEALLAQLKELSAGNKSNEKAMKDAEEEAKKLIDRMETLKDETDDLNDKGTNAIRELSQENIKDLEKIDETINNLKQDLIDLKDELDKDLLEQDKNIAEKIVDEQEKIVDLQNKLTEARTRADEATKKSAQELTDMQERLAVLQQKKTEQTSKTSASQISSLNNEIADLQRKISEAKAGESSGGDIADLETEIAKRQKALDETKNLQDELSSQITEAQRRAGLTDLQRSVEDYLAKKQQIQQEYDDKKLQLENQLALEEDNKQKTIQLLSDKQEQINSIIEIGNQRFKELADGRVKITEEEVKKQVAWYNKLADAIAQSKSATRTTELPQFHQGGYVATGGEVHAGEYVIPANMVNKYDGLVRALDSVRNGDVSNISNSITMNNSINEQIDMDAVLKAISFELNK